MNRVIKKILILSTVLVLGFAAWYIMFIYPKRIELKIVGSQFSALMREVKSATVQVAQIDQLKNQIRDLETSISAIEKRLKDKREIPGILRKMSRLGRRYHLKFSAIYPKYDELLRDVASDGAPLLILPVEMQVKGNFRNIGVFISQFPKQGYLFAVVRVVLAMTKDSYPLINATVRGNLFLKREHPGPKIG